MVYRIYFWKQFSKCCIERKRFFLCRMTRWTYGIWVWDNWVKITGIKITGVNNLFSATIVIWFNYCYLVHRIYFSKYCMQRNIIFSTIVFLKTFLLDVKITATFYFGYWNGSWQLRAYKAFKLIAGGPVEPTAGRHICKYK